MMTRLMKESFIPVLLVISAIFVLVAYSNQLAQSNADLITIIDIPATPFVNDQIDDVESEFEINELTQIEKMRSDEPKLAEAFSLIEQKRWRDAEVAYKKLLADYHSSQGYFDLGYIYYRQRKFEAALNQFDISLVTEPVYVASYYYRARTYHALRQVEEAKRDYKLFIEYMPSNFAAHFNLGLLHYGNKAYQRAVDVFSLASTLAPGRKKSRALYYLGKSYHKLGENYYAQAKHAYENSIRVFPGNIRPRMGLAGLLPDTEQGRQAAKEIYQQVLKLKPSYSRAHSALATLYRKEGNIHEAIASYRHAVEYQPVFVAARFNLGLLYLKQKQWHLAAEQFQAITVLDPKHARAFFNLARTRYRLKQYDLAESLYKTALELRNGDYPEVTVNLGLIHSARNEYTQAIRLYKKAISKQGESAKLRYNIGVAYSKSGQYNKALESFHKAVQLKQDYEQAWYNIALIHSRNQKYQEAVDAYYKAVAIRPDYRSAQLNLAVNLVRMHQLAEAEKVYRDILETSPRYASAWINLGLVLLDQHKYSQAEEVLRLASQLDSEADRVTGLLAKSLQMQEKYDEAIKYYREAIDREPHSYPYRLAYVQVLKANGNYKDALDEANKAIQLYPENQQLKTELKKINDMQQIN